MLAKLTFSIRFNASTAQSLNRNNICTEIYFKMQKAILHMSHVVVYAEWDKNLARLNFVTILATYIKLNFEA